jgi:hypothetical protein
MKTTVWILTAALAMPAVAALGQQNATQHDNESNYASQHDGNQSSRDAHQSNDQNHAMRTGSPNDNGAGLTDNYGKSQPGSKEHKKHKKHHHKSKNRSNERVPNQTDSRYTGEAHPQ